MNDYFLHYPVGYIAMEITLGIVISIDMERIWAYKEAGIRTFSTVALPGILPPMVASEMITVSMIAIFRSYCCHDGAPSINNPNYELNFYSFNIL